MLEASMDSAVSSLARSLASRARSWLPAWLRRESRAAQTVTAGPTGPLCRHPPWLESGAPYLESGSTRRERTRNLSMPPAVLRDDIRT